MRFLCKAMLTLGFWFLAVNFMTGCALLSSARKDIKVDTTSLECTIAAEKTNLEEAQAICSQCLSVDRKNSQCLNAMGTILYYGDPIEAAKYFQRAIKYDNKNYTAYNNLGTHFAKTGKRDEAILNLTKAHVLKPDYFEALFNHAHVLFRWGSDAHDLRILKEALVLVGRARMFADDRITAPIKNLEKAIKVKINLLSN